MKDSTLTDHLFETRVVEFGKTRYSNPLVIGGFVGAGLAGLVAASYIVEQLGLHQVAHVRSQHIPPVAVFIGENCVTHSGSTPTVLEKWWLLCARSR